MQWLSDFRYGWRALVRTPGFLVTSVATLALAIGAVVGMFSVVNTVLLQPLPFPDSDRLVVLSGTAPGSDLPERFGLGQEFYVHYKERSQLLDGIFLFGGGTSTLRTENRVERIAMAFPTNDIYATLGARPQVGRLPVPDDGNRVAVISDRLWSTWFGRDPAVVGKTYYISGEMRQVIGVMPPEFNFPTEETLLWVARRDQAGRGSSRTVWGSRDRAHEAGGHTRPARRRAHATLEGAPGPLRRVAQLRADHRAAQRGRGAGARPPRRSDGQDIPVGAAGRGDGRAAHRVRQRGEPVPGSRRGTPPQPGRASCDRRIARAARPAAAERSVPGRVAGRRAGRDPQRRDAPALSARCSRGHSSTRARAGSTCPRWLPRSAWSSSRHWPAARYPRCTLRRPISVACAMGRAAAPAAVISDAMCSSSGRRRSHSCCSSAPHCWCRASSGCGASIPATRPPTSTRSSSRHNRNASPTGRPGDGSIWTSWTGCARLPGVTTVGVVNNIPLDEGTDTARFLTDSMAPEGGGALLDQNFAGGDYFRVMGIEVLRGRPFTTDEAVTPNSSVIISQSAADPAVARSGSRRTAAPPHRRQAGVVHDRRRGGGREAKRLAGRRRGHRVLSADGTDARHVGDGITRLTSSSRRGRRALPRRCASSCGKWRPKRRCTASSPWSSWRSAPWSQLSFTMLTLGVVSALAMILGAVGLYGVLVVRRRRADARDWRAHGARRNRRRGAAHGGVPGSEGGDGRHRRGVWRWRWRRRAFWMRCSTKSTRWIPWCSWRCRSC